MAYCIPRRVTLRHVIAEKNEQVRLANIVPMPKFSGLSAERRIIMAQINIANLTFCYDGSFDNIFENVSFSIDTDWKLGLIGRNGKGKTTFLNLLRGKYAYQGTIGTSAAFDYFPYHIEEELTEECCCNFLERLKPGCELWRVICEMEKMRLDAEALYRPFGTLSHGERTKVMLAVLFSGENDFLLIDEPTNHLEQEARELVKEYLAQKKGFILVSHDRDLLDACIDHVLVLNRKSIEVQGGNFSSWWENKCRADNFHQAENEKHKKEIAKLKRAADRAGEWADKNERTKIGFDPVKENDRSISTRAYIGAKTKKMQSRVKQLEKRIGAEIAEKEGLLEDIEKPVDLKIMPVTHHKELLIRAKGYGLSYAKEKGGRASLIEGDFAVGVQEVFHNFDFELRQGERVFLHGKNGCGKSSFIKAVLTRCGEKAGGSGECHVRLQEGGRTEADTWKAGRWESLITETGELVAASGLIISYCNQDTSFLRGSLKDFASARELEESLFLAVLRQLDFERVQFSKNMEEYSEGQKKKVLLAASLLKPAHLYIWDEPLNYIDVFSRMQIEKLILDYQPTMLIVEHDMRFRERIATRVAEMKSFAANDTLQ